MTTPADLDILVYTTGERTAHGYSYGKLILLQKMGVRIKAIKFHCPNMFSRVASGAGDWRSTHFATRYESWTFLR